MQFDATRYKPIQGGVRAVTCGAQHIARGSGSHATSIHHENVGLPDLDSSCLQPGHDLGRGPGADCQIGPHRSTQGRGPPVRSRVRGTRGRQGWQRGAKAGNVRATRQRLAARAVCAATASHRRARRRRARRGWGSRTRGAQGPRPASFVQQAPAPRENTMTARARIGMRERGSQSRFCSHSPAAQAVITETTGESS